MSIVLEKFTDFLFPITPQEKRRRNIAVTLGATGVFFLASHINTEATPAPEPVKTLFSVTTPEGPVDCKGEQREVVVDGGTVADLVVADTIRVNASGSFMTPDLKPIVEKVLDINFIKDEKRILAGESIIIPQFCEFAP